MDFQYRSNLSEAIARLKKDLDTARSPAAQVWAEQSARCFESEIQGHLATQGRGGETPPLSPTTRRIYQQDGEPDGSGIRNHLQFYRERSSHGVAAGIGIPEGKPTIVARVQDRGATIVVSKKMRGYFLARYGIPLAVGSIINVPGRKFLQRSSERANEFAKIKLRELFKI